MASREARPPPKRYYKSIGSQKTCKKFNLTFSVWLITNPINDWLWFRTHIIEKRARMIWDTTETPERARGYRDATHMRQRIVRHFFIQHILIVLTVCASTLQPYSNPWKMVQWTRNKATCQSKYKERKTFRPPSCTLASSCIYSRNPAQGLQNYCH